MRASSSAPRASRRRESSRLAILDAVVALCREEGYARLSIEGIAARAGVGKQTIYRWWPSKGAVLLDALDHEVSGTLIIPDTGDVVADMRAAIADVVWFMSNPNAGPAFAALIAEAQQDPALVAPLLERLKPRRTPIAERLRRAQEAGQLAQTLDVDATLEVIFGALFHRLLLRSGPLDDVYASLVVDTVFGGVAAVRKTEAPERRQAGAAFTPTVDSHPRSRRRSNVVTSADVR